MKNAETIVEIQRKIEIIAHQEIKTCIICSNNICINFDKQEIYNLSIIFIKLNYRLFDKH